MFYEHVVYVQPINYPTVLRGGERLCFTPSPFHDDALILDLVRAMTAVLLKHRMSQGA